MQTNFHNTRSSRSQRASTAPTTPSRASRTIVGPTQQAQFSPRQSNTASSAAVPTGPALFPTTLVRLPLVMNNSGLLTQATWALPPLNASVAMLLTAIAMELDSNDPSPATAPHVGLYWSKSADRTKFFRYIVTIIHKLCVLVDGVTDSTIIVEAISSDDRNCQMRYASRVVDTIPEGRATVDAISAQAVALAGHACDADFKRQRRSQYDSNRNMLTVWSDNGAFLPAKWADAPLPIRFDHDIVPALQEILRAHATQSPASPFLRPHTIDMITSPAIRIRHLPALHPAISLVTNAPEPDHISAVEDEEPSIDIGEKDYMDSASEEWIPFAKYKGLRETIQDTWCAQFGIGPEYADSVRVMLYEEDPSVWGEYLRSFFKVGRKRAMEMADALEDYVSSMPH